ncbi:MAG: proton-conducting transporter membrane subunit [Spirosomataceae bacterium]
MESIVFVGICGVSMTVLLVPRRWQYYFSLFLHVFLSLTGLSWAFRALLEGGTKIFPMLNGVGFLPVLTIDSLSAYFILLVSFGMITAILYTGSYLKPYRKKRTRTQLGIHHLAFLWLHISMLLVTVLRDGLFFLSAWEIMSLSLFGLFSFPADTSSSRLPAFNYLIQTQVGLLLLGGAMWYVHSLGYAFGLDGFEGYFAQHSVLCLFIVLLIGFGISAGWVPLFLWLSPGHSIASAPVAGVLYGIGLKIGMYGLLRVLTNVHSDIYAVGAAVLAVSIASGIWGVLKASSQTDINQFLTYHSIGNNGIIGLGIGAGLLGKAFQIADLAALAFTGSLLHIFNHSLFQSLLFYGAGAVSQSAHSLDLNQMGGLMKSMPKTAFFFLLGAASLCGIPPLNGFISEFLMVIGLFKGINATDDHVVMWSVGSLIVLVMISGWAIYHFAKAFFRIFLGVPRTIEASQAEETSENMLFSMLLTALPIVVIGLLPNFFINRLAKVTDLYVSDTSSVRQAIPPFFFIGLSAVLFGIASFLLWQRCRPSKKEILAEHPSS